MWIYEKDALGVYTGNSKDAGPRDPIPKNWTHIAPPDGPGYHIFDGHKWFTREEYPKPPARGPKREAQITVGEFYDRFGEHKYEVLSSDDALVQAMIKDVSVRGHVNLDDPQLISGLQELTSRGFPIDVEQIIGRPIEDEVE